MHCKHNIGKVVKLHGDAITLYAGYPKRNFKKCHLISLGRFSVNNLVGISLIAICLDDIFF